MKVTYNWLQDFVTIKISPEALADKLSLAGLEVTSLEHKEGDFVFEIEITANRPDLLNVVGIAREIAAITNKKLRLPQAASLKPQIKSLKSAACSLQPITIKIEDKKDCPLYTAKIIQDVKVAPSPGWMQQRLELVGCRSVNNIVDITNYVLFEWGEPLHAFDLDKLRSQEIIVRRASSNEELMTIDGAQRKLDQGILVIADQKIPVAIAGVMGGKDTEVSEKTQNILLEAAIFNPVLIRHARQRLNLQSESAYRFERGIDSRIVGQASEKATRLICAHTTGRFSVAESSGGLKEPQPKLISLAGSDLKQILGTEIKKSRVKKIFSDLGFKAQAKGKDSFVVKAPSFRQDVCFSIDLIEEVARIFGYPRIPTSLPAIKPQVTASSARDLVSRIKNILVGLGLNEVITYSLIDKESLQGITIPGNPSLMEIINPLSKNEAVLRPTLILSLARCIAYNLSQQQEYLNIFEVAKVFSEDSGRCKEELVLGIALCGTKSWLLPAQGMVKDSAGPLNLKGILGVLLERLGIKDLRFSQMEGARLSLGLGQDKIGWVLSLPKNILAELDIKNKEVWLAEISMDKLFSCIKLQKRFESLPVYPGITRDISILIKEEISAEEILQAVKEKAGPLLEKASIADYYKGKQIPAGSKGLTISCFYRSAQRTLTEAEIQPLHSQATKTLIERFDATIR